MDAKKTYRPTDPISINDLIEKEMCQAAIAYYAERIGCRDSTWEELRKEIMAAGDRFPIDTWMKWFMENFPLKEDIMAAGEIKLASVKKNEDGTYTANYHQILADVSGKEFEVLHRQMTRTKADLMEEIDSVKNRVAGYQLHLSQLVGELEAVSKLEK